MCLVKIRHKDRCTYCSHLGSPYIREIRRPICKTETYGPKTEIVSTNEEWIRKTITLTLNFRSLNFRKPVDMFRDSGSV